MTVEKIVEEMKKRYAVLDERENKLRIKAREFRRRKPFGSMTDEEIDRDSKAYHALYKLQQPFYDKANKIAREKSIIRDMLWEYEKNCG